MFDYMLESQNIFKWNSNFKFLIISRCEKHKNFFTPEASSVFAVIQTKQLVAVVHVAVYPFKHWTVISFFFLMMTL